MEVINNIKLKEWSIEEMDTECSICKKTFIDHQIFKLKHKETCIIKFICVHCMHKIYRKDFFDNHLP